MKHLLLLITLVAGLTCLPQASLAKDKDDYGRKTSKDLRNELSALEQHYSQVKDRVKNQNGDRRNWQGLQQIRANIDSIGGQLNSGNFDPRDIHGRIQQSHGDLQSVQDNLDRDNQRRGGYGGYYRPN